MTNCREQAHDQVVCIELLSFTYTRRGDLSHHYCSSLTHTRIHLLEICTHIQYIMHDPRKICMKQLLWLTNLLLVIIDYLPIYFHTSPHFWLLMAMPTKWSIVAKGKTVSSMRQPYQCERRDAEGDRVFCSSRIPTCNKFISLRVHTYLLPIYHL